ncbi:FAD-dependent oxidoreductase [Halococcus salsus]|uniref:FAD-dependent oxidoreductase n=1 Tax=Halococcus salsus TaxID=2162894 RepID=UPI00135AD3BB|nr:FAD-dependent oxidoreductase [Halococcus salsus]
MNCETDVLVVGGGATGVGVARDLAMRDVDVTLCERGGLGSGTTGRSHGVLHSGARYAESDAEGARECIAENRIVKRTAGACVRDSGGYFVALDDDDPDYFEAKLAGCRAQDIPAEPMSGAAAREAVPALADDVERVIEVPDAVVYPSRLVAATAESARRHGARVLPDAPVTDLHTENGRVVGATVDHDGGKTVRTNHVVNAAGAWAGEIAAKAGVEVSMQPTKGVMVGVEGVEVTPVLNRCRSPADGDLVVPHDDEVVLGTTSVAVDDPDEYSREDEAVDRMVAECAAMVPALENRNPDRTYWGVRPLYAPDEDERDGARSISRGFFLLDHADDGVGGFSSIVGGKLTTHRRMAEAVADHVCDALGVDGTCRTADEPLPGHDDPAELDDLVDAYVTDSPADSDLRD